VLGKLLRRPSPPRGPRLLFATDVHGSDRCFRKFLNAGSLYQVDFLILGGDITGKVLVPLVQRPSGAYDCKYGGVEYRDLTESAAADLIKTIRGFGHYTVTVDAPELEQMQIEEHRDRVFREVVRQSIQAWVTLAEDRLRGTGIRCFMAPGNDDFLSIDGAIESSTLVEFAENRLLQLDDKHEMITTGYSNPTPWDTERELPEDALRKRIDGMANAVKDPQNLVAVLHAPPYASGLDDAPKLSDDLELTLNAGGVEMSPVGSTAVRGFIEAAQPLLGLHGHVHEGRGTTMIGRTLCINPGSAYTEGVLSAALVELGDGCILSHQFISG
jgi:Icc-related predicted phosphoesterase